MNIEITDEDRKEAQRLLDQGYYQVSRAYRTLARLPEDHTGKEALLSHGWDVDQVDHLGEAHCGDQYLRVYAPMHFQAHVTPEVFAAFRQLGGDTYLGKHSAHEPMAVIGECRNLLVELRVRPASATAARIEAAIAHAEACLAYNERRPPIESGRTSYNAPHDVQSIPVGRKGGA